MSADTPVTIMSPTPPSNTDSTSPEPELPGTSGGESNAVDPQILEALGSKDRIYVLKLGELIEGLIAERQQSQAQAQSIQGQGQGQSTWRTK
ncbi:hypothetical protein B0H16DRAFT_1019450 [Mycena metata]|uniref:Uncharacterized protein n=1 Tax=Mycena metata TaxID=1033252 RepID=A0AAD7N2I0_9AGAR|nr:hypothetical protein B0H16DRAFT_1019450 [Mycena metata]